MPKNRKQWAGTNPGSLLGS